MTLTNKQKTIYVAFLLVAATMVFYSGVLGNGFVNFDDNDYVTSNAIVQKGLSWEGIKWAFTSFHASNWHPLTWLSHMLDVQLFGLNPAGHHLMNLIFHICATFLLFGFLSSATGKIWLSGFASALFALHPMHVESVAWVAERKDVLSASFYFATLWAYVYYSRFHSLKKYALAIILFTLGLMAKPMLVSLPFMLLLLDYWPLGRFKANFRNISRVASEKIPFILLAAISSSITIFAQQTAIASLNKIYLSTRISNAIVSYCIYIWQGFWPFNLSVLYPFTRPEIANVVICSLILVTITVVVLWQVIRSPILFTGWVWYLITLIPVIGIVQVGSQAHADRYTYVPYVGLFIIAVWGANTLLNKLKYRKRMLLIVTFLLTMFALAIITRQQITFWKNDFTLFSHAIKVTKNNAIAYGNLGFFYENDGQIDQAIACYQRALDIYSYFDAHFNLGNTLMQKGQTDNAINHYLKALEIKPNNIKVLSNLAGAYFKKRQYSESLQIIQKAIGFAKIQKDTITVQDLEANLQYLNEIIAQTKTDSLDYRMPK
jgi:protein O-mannosyl-transferase